MLLKQVVIFFLFVCVLTACSTWDEVEVKKGGFAIEFPGPPRDTAQIEGAMLSHKTYYQDMNAEKNSYYSVTYIDIPAVMDSSKLIDACEWAKASFPYDMMLFARTIGGTLRNDSVIVNTGNIPARQFKVEFSDKSGTITTRKFCTGKRIYTLMVITKAEAANNEFIKHFFDSFRLLK